MKNVTFYYFRKLFKKKNRKLIWDQPSDVQLMLCVAPAHCHVTPLFQPVKNSNALLPTICHAVFMMPFMPNKRYLNHSSFFSNKEKKRKKKDRQKVKEREERTKESKKEYKYITNVSFHKQQTKKTYCIFSYLFNYCRVCFQPKIKSS